MKTDCEEFLKELLHPSAEFSSVPFWFFNDEPDPDKIKAQLMDMKNKGIDAFVLHPRIGIPKDIPYLSNAFFEVVRFILQTAKDLNMKVCLYDEGMYPSGSAHGAVVRENPDFAAKGIYLADPKEVDEKRAGETIAVFPDGKRLLYTFTGGTIRGIHFGEDDGENPPPAADLLNPQAVKTFIHLTHDRYYAECKPYFGNTIFAFFTDEPDPVGRNAAQFRPWYRGLKEDILTSGGRLEDLRALFSNEENETTRLYRRLVKKRLRETFYKPLSIWCETHGIVLMGHPALSNDVEEEFYFQYPGQDLIQRRIEPKTGGVREADSVHAKLVADIARACGRKRNINECFGVCCRNGWPWYMTAEDMKWYTDWLGFRGCNLFVPHAFFFSVRDGVDGKRSAERPPDVGPHNIWWPHYKHFSDYFKRLSYLNTETGSGAKLAVLCGNNEVPCETVAALYQNQIEFDYLPVQLLKDTSVQGDTRDYAKLRCHTQLYDAVFDPLDLLHKEGKAIQLPVGFERVNVLHTTNETLSKAEQCASWKAVLTKTKQPDLRAKVVTCDGVRSIWLSNEGGHILHFDMQVLASPQENTLLAIDLWNGNMTKLSVQKNQQMFSCSLHLPPVSTLLLIPMTLKEAVNIRRDLKTGQEKEAFLNPMALPDWTGRFKEISPESSTLLKTGTKKTAGSTQTANTKEYQLTLHKDEVDKACFRLKAEEMCELFVDSKLYSVSFWNPHVFDLRNLSGKEQYELKLVVTGNAANLYTKYKIPFGLGVDNGDGRQVSGQ